MPCKFSSHQEEPGVHNTILENQDTVVPVKSRLRMADFWSNMLKSNQQNEKRFWAIETSKPHSARTLRAFFYIDPEDSEFGETMKSAHKFWK